MPYQREYEEYEYHLNEPEMSEESDHIDDLFCAIEMLIYCEECQHRERGKDCDDDDFVKIVYDKGWRSDDGIILCPACAKKHNIK